MAEINGQLCLPTETDFRDALVQVSLQYVPFADSSAPIVAATRFFFSGKRVRRIRFRMVLPAAFPVGPLMFAAEIHRSGSASLQAGDFRNVSAAVWTPEHLGCEQIISLKIIS
jgi:hypothetical protein